jgi:hypothetical protein
MVNGESWSVVGGECEWWSVCESVWLCVCVCCVVVLCLVLCLVCLEVGCMCIVMWRENHLSHYDLNVHVLSCGLACRVCVMGVGKRTRTHKWWCVCMYWTKTWYIHRCVTKYNNKDKTQCEDEEEKIWRKKNDEWKKIKWRREWRGEKKIVFFCWKVKRWLVDFGECGRFV